MIVSLLRGKYKCELENITVAIILKSSIKLY